VTGADTFESVETVTERVLATIREPIAVADALLYVSASVGIAFAPSDGADANSLLHSADTAMYASKASGRDRRTYFQPAMNEAAELLAATRHRLTSAIRNRELRVVYQPVLDIATGEVRAVESLMRWQDGDRTVPAAEFIDVAIETGQIRAMGRMVLGLVHADLQGNGNGSALDGLNVAVNLSADELNERDTFEWLAAWQPPRGGYERIVVEVTEAALVRQASRAIETVTLLRRLGASLAIDDFGVGYSNLSLLGQLNPDIIKIDRSLLLGAEGPGRGMELLDASVRMARALGASVVLEGVETTAQEDIARDLGVGWTQGFLRARPMPLEELEVWLRDRGASGTQPG
jgi:two-component system CheB/CheR fusion protein